jgi:hypothetical protein
MFQGELCRWHGAPGPLVRVISRWHAQGTSGDEGPPTAAQRLSLRTSGLLMPLNFIGQKARGKNLKNASQIPVQLRGNFRRQASAFSFQYGNNGQSCIFPLSFNILPVSQEKALDFLKFALVLYLHPLTVL